MAVRPPDELAAEEKSIASRPEMFRSASASPVGSSGTLLARTGIYGGCEADPVAGDGMVFFASLDQSIYGYDLGGNQVWRLRTEHPLRTTPTYHDGVVLDYDAARRRRQARGHEPLVRDYTTLPNVEAYSYYLEHGTKCTLYRSTPGDTRPRMQMILQDGRTVDAGFVDNPERFGSYNDFRRWCQRFSDHALTNQEP